MTACEAGHLKTVKQVWFSQHKGLMPLMSHVEAAFVSAWRNGHWNVAHWLYTMKPNMCVSFDANTMYRVSCCNDRFDSLTLLHTVNPAFADAVAWMYYPNDMYENGVAHLFCRACEFGHLRVAQFMFSVNPTEQVDVKNAFVCSCAGGHLRVAKWLLMVNPTISDPDLDWFWRALRCACNKGHLHVAKWLRQICTADIFEFGESICWQFRSICHHGQLAVAKWYLENCPRILKWLLNDDEYTGNDFDVFTSEVRTRIKSIRDDDDENENELNNGGDECGSGIVFGSDLNTRHPAIVKWLQTNAKKSVRDYEQEMNQGYENVHMLNLL